MASNSPMRNKATMEQFRKNLEKRSLNVKFALENTDYKAIENIGIGAYGVVCSAIHSKTNDRVAIKKIPNVFEALTLTKRTYREIKILKHFKHDNIISIREIIKPVESYKDFKEIYVVFDLMESDLHKIIYTDQELTEEHIRYFLYQILRGLKYIHSANVIHRDLKPSNLLVNEDCHVRIGDFGMSRGIFYERSEPAFFMTQYVATRWYRAPEILLSLIEYGTAVDMWSVGCIFAEMLGRKHFFPGKDYISQIKLIVGLLGSPSEDVLKNCQNVIIRDIIKKLGHRTAIPWKTLFPKASRKSLDLLSKMLIINPANRISVDKALEHLFLNKYHDPDDEPICVPAFNFDFEKESMDKEMLREVIYKEIMEYHQPRTPTFSFNAVLRPAPKPEPTDFVLTSCPPIEKKQLDEQLKDFLQTFSPEKPCVDEKTECFKEKPAQMTEVLFKKPAMKKKSPVTVDTTTLLPSQTSDVEMLSAKLSEHKTKGVEVKPVIAKKPDKENKAVEASESGNVTVSMGTKARILQALQNASERRQRTESVGDEGEKRPVTAAQRQREREEKRKKKKDRAWERKKVKEKKNAPVFLLSDADKEMLQRWSQMQQVATGTPVNGTSMLPHVGPGQTIIITTVSQTILQSVVQTEQPLQPGAVSSKVMGQIEQPHTATNTLSNVVMEQTVQPPQPTTVSSVVQDSSAHSQSTVLQTKSHIASAHNVTSQFQHSSPGHSTESSQTNMEHDFPSKAEHQLQSGMFESSGKTFQEQTSALQQSHPYPQHQNVFNVNHNGHSEMDQSLQEQSSNSLFSQASQQINSHTLQEQTSNSLFSQATQQINSHTEPPATGLTGHPTFSQANNSSLVDQATNLHAFSQQNNTVFHFPQGFSNPSSTCQSHVYSQESGSQATTFTHHQRQQQEMFAGLSFPPSQPAGSASQELFSTSPHQPFSNFTSSSTQPAASTSHKLFSTSPHQPFSNFTSSSTQPAASTSHKLFSTSPHQPFSNFTSSSTQHVCNSYENMRQTRVQSADGEQFNYDSARDMRPTRVQSADGEQFNYDPARGMRQTRVQSADGDQFQQKFLTEAKDHVPAEQHTIASQNKISPQPHRTPSRQPQDLKIKCSPPIREPQVPGNHQDLIALLSKQLMKSGVADPFPPALSLTPKGTGGGYGVGNDLDALMVDAHDVSRIEQSPLSSSLIADWLDISGNITQADLEALEREMEIQSPMSLSYSDLNLPNPP